MSSGPRTLHVVVATLREDLSVADRDGLAQLGGALETAPGVERSLLAADRQYMVVATWLPPGEPLEAFAASAQHMSFVVRGLSHAASSVWSIAVGTEHPPPPAAPSALWAFALPGEGAYDWQVRDVLTAISGLPGHVCAGPTIEERDRFRLGGVIALASVTPTEFLAAVDGVSGAWADLAGELQSVLVAVAGR